MWAPPLACAFISLAMTSLSLSHIGSVIRIAMQDLLELSRQSLQVTLAHEQHIFLNRIHQKSQHLASVINDGLDLNALEIGQLSLEPSAFSLPHLLAELIRQAMPEARQKNIALSYLLPTDFPPLIEADAIRLRQIVQHLLSNALQFTTEGEVEVQLRHAPAAQDATLRQIEICVRDTGPGISHQQQHTIFQLSHATNFLSSRGYGRGGLGLQLSLSLAQLMNGSLQVQSEPLMGAIFSLRLLVKVAYAPEKLRPECAVLKNKNFLVVDPNYASRKMLVDWLKAIGANAQGVPELEDALEKTCDAFVIDSATPENPQAELKGPHLILSDGSTDLSTTTPLGHCAPVTLLKPLLPDEFYQGLARALTHVSTQREKAHALVVEDNAVNRFLAEVMLQKLGFEVFSVENGAQAVENCQQNNYDLVIMDIQMPTMDGLEATRLIRAQEKNSRRHTPIVALTANVMEGDREICLNAGMDGYLAKPVSVSQLSDEISRVLKR